MMKMTLSQLEHRIEAMTPEDNRAEWTAQVRELAEARIRRQPGKVRALADVAVKRLPADDNEKLELLLWFARLFMRDAINEEAIEFLVRALGLAESMADTQTTKVILGHLSMTEGRAGNYGKALKYQRMLLDRFQSDHDGRGVCRSLTEIGTLYWHLGEFDRALEFQYEALKLCESISALDLQEAVLNNLGLVYFKMGNLEEALAAHQRSLSLKETRGNRAGIAKSLTNIGIIHRNLGHGQIALECHQKSLDYYREVDDRRGVSQCLLNIGLVHEDLGNHDQALDFQRKALKIKQQIKDYYGMSICYSNIGDILLMNHEPESALENYHKALAIVEELWDKWQISHLSLVIAEASIQLNRFEDAEVFLEQGLKIAREIDSKDQIAEYFLQYSQFYELKGNFSEALAQYREYISVRDSRLAEKHLQTMRELRTGFDIEKRSLEAKLSLERAENERIRNGELVNRNIDLVKTNLRLLEANELIQKQHRELSEVYDRLEQLARFDPLTNLANRRFFHERVVMEKERAERTGKSFILILADIDNFRSINDQYGHDIGDYVLVAIGQTFKEALRKQDFIARWGGEEIIVLLPETNIDGGAVVAEKLRDAVASRKFFADGTEFPVTMTFGYCVYHGGVSISECIKKADEAVLVGKQTGKNRCVRMDIE
jgi:diguanylate cyclase (GGDEF)-like protein